MAKVVCVGEAMLELSSRDGDWRLGYGGDTLNTAIHFARLGHQVSYFTAVGSDPLSEGLRKRLEDEGLDCSLVLAHPSRHAGLYAISTDKVGERSFTYWREASAAREMFALPGSGDAAVRAAQCDLLYFSLISLAILPAEGRRVLFDLVARARQNGAGIGFDSNYRARLWDSADSARVQRDRAISLSDFGLPTLDDEIALSGAADAETVASYWAELGCAECLVKLGAAGCRLPDGVTMAPAQELASIDTSGAGDAFNAGYLSSRLNGVDPTSSAKTAHLIAGWTIMRPGAIPPRDSEYPSLNQ